MIRFDTAESKWQGCLIKIRISLKEKSSFLMENNLLWELPLKVLLSSQKWLGRKNTTLVCVTRKMILAYLNFEHQSNNMSYRLSLLKLKNFPVTKLQKHVKSDHFGKVYFDPLHVSLRSRDCMYDIKNLKLICPVGN